MLQIRNILVSLFALGIFNSQPAGAQTIYVSEVMASNDASLGDEDGDDSDWIELYNASETSVDLDGWCLAKPGEVFVIYLPAGGGTTCRVQTGIEGKLKVVGLDASKVTDLGGGMVEVDLKKGETAVLAEERYKGDFVIRPVEKKFHTDCRWGIK